MSFMEKISPYLKMILALICGMIGSIIFIYLNLPLPWLLGSIFITSILIQFENNYIKRPSHIFSTPARIIIGLVIGSAFTPEVLEYLSVYFFSILLNGFLGLLLLHSLQLKPLLLQNLLQI